jgi:hypothetical protein
MAHLLNWSIGHRGKGLVSAETGDVHTWNVGLQGSPEHDEYAQDKNIYEGHDPFFIDPDGYIHNDPFEPLSQGTAEHAQMADSNLHSFKADEPDWTLDPVMPQSTQIDEGEGPDYNFIMHGSVEDPDEYSEMLKQWLDGVQPQDPAPPPTPHHETIADLAPGAPQQPAHAPPYWPPGHVPDWAEPSSAGVTAASPKPEPDCPRRRDHD